MKLTPEKKRKLANLIGDYGQLQRKLGAAFIQGSNCAEIAKKAYATYCEAIDLIYGDTKDAN